jgi:hypothetical protein
MSCWHLFDFVVSCVGKVDVQVVVCNCVGDPLKAWVAGSGPAALTKYSEKPRQIPAESDVDSSSGSNFLNLAEFGFCLELR